MWPTLFFFVTIKMKMYLFFLVSFFFCFLFVNCDELPDLVLALFKKPCQNEVALIKG